MNTGRSNPESYLHGPIRRITRENDAAYAPGYLREAVAPYRERWTPSQTARGRNAGRAMHPLQSMDHGQFVRGLVGCCQRSMPALWPQRLVKLGPLLSCRRVVQCELPSSVCQSYSFLLPAIVNDPPPQMRNSPVGITPHKIGFPPLPSTTTVVAIPSLSSCRDFRRSLRTAGSYDTVRSYRTVLLPKDHSCAQRRQA